MLVPNWINVLHASIFLVIFVRSGVESQNINDFLRNFEVNFEQNAPKSANPEALRQYTRDKRTIHSFLASIGDIFGLDVTRRASSAAVVPAQLQVTGPVQPQVAQLANGQLAQIISVSSPADGALQRQVLVSRTPTSETRRGFGFNINFRRSATDTRR